MLLRRQGYAATGLAQIVRESGVTTGSLYHHFPGGKEDLAVAALTLSASVVTEHLQRALAPPTEPAQAFVRWLEAIADDLMADPRDGCPVAPVALEAVHSSERLRSAASEAFRTWADQITDRLIQDGWPKARASNAAQAVLALVEGALLLSRTTGDREPLRNAAANVALLLRPEPEVSTTSSSRSRG